jgi:hypothetical protein
MKSLFFIILSVLVLTSCGKSEKEKKDLQINKFETKLKLITEVSPDTMYLHILKNLSDKHTDPNSGFSGWTPEMIQSQAAYTYHAESEDLIKLVVEMLVYKKIVTSKGVSINELQSFVDRVRSDKSDKIDTMIIESFDLAIQYEETYLKLKPSNYYY